MKKGIAIVLIVIGAFCVAGAVIGTIGVLGAATEVVENQGQTDVERTAAAKSAAAKGPATIEDGTWTVGVDVKAGTYKVSANVESSCYWSITKTNGGPMDIIRNDIPGGGRPQVSLKKGQDFHTRDCGTWVKR